MLHAAFLRSPYAHAQDRLDRRGAGARCPRRAPGRDRGRSRTYLHALDRHARPFQGHELAAAIAVAARPVVWAGQAVVAVVAESRAMAEDAPELIEVEFEELPGVVDIDGAREPGVAAHLSRLRQQSSASTARSTTAVWTTSLRIAAHVVEEEFRFGRHTAVTLEPRAIVADYDRREPRLTVHHADPDAVSVPGPLFAPLWHPGGPRVG